MLKKVFTIPAAVMLILSLASSALATFADQELIRVVYERTTGTTEFATDLGLVTNIVATSSTTKPGFLPVVTNSNNLFVSYFALDRNSNEIWVSGSTDTTKAPVVTGGVAMNTYKNGTTPMYGYYTSLTPDANGTVTGAQSNPSSYKTKLTANQGRLGTALNIASGPFTEANLSTLVNASATDVTQLLYYFSNGTTASSTGVAVATITTHADGSTTISNHVADTTPPLVTIDTPPPTTSTSATISVGFTATDAVGVTGYLLTDTPTPPLAADLGWITTTPAVSFNVTSNFTFAGLVTGINNKTLYVWARDAAGNVSAQKSSAIEITISNTITPIINWAAPAAVSYGTVLNASQLNASASDPGTTAGIPGTYAYSPTLGSILNAGNQTLSLTFTPTDSVTYAVATATVSLNVNKALLTVTADSQAKTINTANPNLTYNIIGFVNGDSTAVLNGTSPVLSTTAVTSSPAGNYPISVTAGTLAATNYNFVFINGILTVNAQLVPTITWATPNSVNYGTPLTATQLNASANVPGTFVYSPVSGSVLNAGIQTLSASFTPTDSITFSGQTASVSLTVNKAAPVITWAPPAVITYGTPLSATQLNASSNVQGTFVYSPALNSVLNAGNQVLLVTFTPTDSANYATATASVSMTIIKKALTVTADNMTKTINTANPPLTYTVTGFTNGDGIAVLNGTIPALSTPAVTSSPVGSYPIISAAGTLAAANYSFDFVNGSLTVTSQITPVITWVPPAAITYGTPLSSFQLNAASTVAGSFIYSPAIGSVPNSGVQNLSVTFNPTDTATYATVTSTVSLTVNKATPTISWSVPAAITYGTPLSTSQLNAASTVAGTFVYAPLSGSVPGAGLQAISVMFTPNDSTNYVSGQTASVSLTVNKAILNVTAENLAKTINTPNPPLTYTISGYVNGDSSAVLNGTIPALSTTAVTNSPVGAYPVNLTAGTLAAVNYSFAFSSGILTVNPQVLPTISWATPAAITYGVPLSTEQLNATASVPGIFTYSPVAGNVLAAGIQNLSVTFTPTDKVGFATATSTISMTVNKAVLTVTANSLSKTVNTANPQLTYTVSGFVNGESAAVLNGTTPGLSTPAVANSPIGSYPITVSVGSLAATNYIFSVVNGTLAINGLSVPVISWATPVAITYGASLSASQLNASANVPGTFVYSPTPGSVLNAGIQTLSVTFTPSDSINYTTTTATANLTVNRASPVISWATPSAIIINTPLSAVQLNASVASVPGTFAYSPAPGTVAALAGAQNLSVTFTPNDAINYTNQTTSVTLQVKYPSGSLNGAAEPLISDALQVLRYTVGIGTLTDVQRANVDVAPLAGGKPAPDKNVDIGDALVILKRVVGIVTW